MLSDGKTENGSWRLESESVDGGVGREGDLFQQRKEGKVLLVKAPPGGRRRRRWEEEGRCHWGGGGGGEDSLVQPCFQRRGLGRPVKNRTNTALGRRRGRGGRGGGGRGGGGGGGGDESRVEVTQHVDVGAGGEHVEEEGRGRGGRGVGGRGYVGEVFC